MNVQLGNSTSCCQLQCGSCRREHASGCLRGVSAVAHQNSSGCRNASHLRLIQHSPDPRADERHCRVYPVVDGDKLHPRWVPPGAEAMVPGPAAPELAALSSSRRTSALQSDAFCIAPTGAQRHALQPPDPANAITLMPGTALNGDTEKILPLSTVTPAYAGTTLWKRTSAEELPRFFRWVILTRTLCAGVAEKPSRCYQQVMHSGFLSLLLEVRTGLFLARAVLVLGSIFW
jgi:hypothetical protein